MLQSTRGFDPFRGVPPMYSLGYGVGWEKGRKEFFEKHPDAKMTHSDKLLLLSQGYTDGFDAGYEDGSMNDYK